MPRVSIDLEKALTDGVISPLQHRQLQRYIAKPKMGWLSIAIGVLFISGIVIAVAALDPDFVTTPFWSGALLVVGLATIRKIVNLDELIGHFLIAVGATVFAAWVAYIVYETLGSIALGSQPHHEQYAAAASLLVFLVAGLLSLNLPMFVMATVLLMPAIDPAAFFGYESIFSEPLTLATTYLTLSLTAWTVVSHVSEKAKRPLRAVYLTSFILSNVAVWSITMWGVPELSSSSSGAGNQNIAAILWMILTLLLAYLQYGVPARRFWFATYVGISAVNFYSQWYRLGEGTPGEMLLGCMMGLALLWWLNDYHKKMLKQLSHMT